MFKPGSIRKIEVKNFVTYSHVEMYPQPNLNMIIGPNGTGKSTMVAAIILGLGGNPKVVGRGTKISEYVKHNCDVATINIFLQDLHDNQFIKVTREFDTQNRNTWKLDNNRVKLDDVLERVKPFNIQVNNLCQFLPQDRVQDFAKLNKQDLLLETQRALCRFDLLEKQELLIQNRQQHKDLTAVLDKCVKDLETAQDLNSRLEGRVQSFNKKKKYQESIEHIDRKIAWITYEEFRAKLSEVKNDRNKAQEVYDRYKKALKPTEQQIDQVKKGITEKQQTNSKTSQAVRTIETSINGGLEKAENLKRSVRRLEDEMETKLGEIEQWDREIEEAKAKLEDMKKLQKEIQAKCASGAQEKQELSAEATKLLGLQKNLRDRKEEFLQLKQDNVIKLRALENESLRLENVKQNRLQYLQRINPDAYTAVIWLRNNKHLFEHEIFEPLLLEINVLDVRQAKYVENSIPMRDRLAFTCTNKNDMNKLIKCLRQDQKLSVNIIHSSAESSSQFHPNIPIEKLRKYGFYTYINNLFTSPDPIMRYLCKTYQLHQIPVGDHTTNTCYEKIPQNIKNFFSDKYRYSISYSKYSGQKSTRQIEISSDNSLSLSLDVVRLDKIRGQIHELQTTIKNNNDQYQGFETQLSKFDDKVRKCRERMKEIQQEKQHSQTVETRIQTTIKKIGEMQQLKKSPEAIRSETRTKIKALIRNMPNIQTSVKEHVKKLTELAKRNSLTTLKIQIDRKKLAYLENKINENRRQCQDAEETLNLIKEKYMEVMNQAKTMLTKAKSLSKGLTPADEGFDAFRDEYDSLPCDNQELIAKRDQLQSRIACLNIADDTEMQEYENRLEAIKKLSEDIEKHNSDMNTLMSKMNRLQNDWLTPLKDLLDQINHKFSSAFERMGCAGEISIYTGDNDKDFSQYGISIKVTYRNGEPLQELNSTVQSGGERAVATAAFMLSLQELTPVPFRCVDEINQGMDTNNERRIFELIVEVTCQRDASQYFLITPKLVPHLNYSPNMTIHIVHNGPFIVQDKKWGFSKICNTHGVQIA